MKTARHAKRARNPELNKVGRRVSPLEYKPHASREAAGYVAWLTDIVLPKGVARQVANCRCTTTRRAPILWTGLVTFFGPPVRVSGATSTQIRLPASICACPPRPQPDLDSHLPPASPRARKQPCRQRPQPLKYACSPSKSREMLRLGTTDSLRLH